MKKLVLATAILTQIFNVSTGHSQDADGPAYSQREIDTSQPEIDMYRHEESGLAMALGSVGTGMTVSAVGTPEGAVGVWMTVGLIIGGSVVGTVASHVQQDYENELTPVAWNVLVTEGSILVRRPSYPPTPYLVDLMAAMRCLRNNAAGRSALGRMILAAEWEKRMIHASTGGMADECRVQDSVNRVMRTLPNICATAANREMARRMLQIAGVTVAD